MTSRSSPPTVAVPEFDKRPSPHQLALVAVAGAVAQLVRYAPAILRGGDDEAVHKFRVATRRLRSDLGTFADVIDDPHTLWLRDELRWLGADVGRLRDIQVLAATLHRAVEDLAAGDVARSRALFARLDRQGRDARQGVLAALRSARYRRLLDALVQSTDSLREQSDLAVERHRKQELTAMRRLERKRWRRLAAAVDVLGEKPSDAALHAVRIKAKRSRYAAEAVSPLAGKQLARFAAAVSDLQTVLGDHQDTVVAEAWLREAAGAVPAGSLVAGELIARERAERARLRTEWPAVWRRVVAARKRATL
ncbi:MAG: CHAD domain-containing protein [Candidatus Dormibacteraeota bacterium]|nr:CHAD domain-containing protein [Candidatus Dormibacteraeota bacterium]